MLQRSSYQTLDFYGDQRTKVKTNENASVVVIPTLHRRLGTAELTEFSTVLSSPVIVALAWQNARESGKPNAVLVKLKASILAIWQHFSWKTASISFQCFSFRHWDISSHERLNMLKEFVNCGLEHWGSDTQVVIMKNGFD